VSQVLLAKQVIAGTAIIPRDELIKEGTHLAEQAYMKVIATAKAKPTLETEETSAMMIKAAAPVLHSDGSLLGVLYGGNLLNRNFEIVDRVKQTIYRGTKYKGKDIGIATIFQGDLRISTNVEVKNGSRAVGTRVSKEVYGQVLEKRRPWIQRAFVVNDWYIAAYEPIKDINREIIGILSTGILEEKFVDMRRSAILDFLGITVAGMIIALVVSGLLARGILKPIKHLVFASRQLAKGNLEYQVKLKSKDEIGELEETFNLMTSSLKERDEKLKEYTSQQIMKSERLATLGQLAAGVAHEINNPLGTISLYAQMTLDELGKDNDSCRENLEVVMKQTNRAGRIVKDLLEFARQSEPEMKILNVNNVLRKAIAITTHPAELQNISLATHLAGELPDVRGDTDKLQQVFVNVIINALQAMLNGGELTVGTRLAENGKFVEIEISDTGCGIPQEDLGKLFDPFFSTKKTGEGTGLGLSVSLGIIQKHNGTIDVKSKIDEGSTFIIRLPAGEN
jgi:two-component system NtrC family sensor kinase